MPEIFLDGRKLEAKQGETIIETAYRHGIPVPHFCWHPELSVSGNCRMCLVETGLPKRLQDGSIEKGENGEPIINFFPKLQIACATQIADGMRVRSVSETAVKAQESVMEFLLINHPLDCPICDEAGECKLQEYAFKRSSGNSRFIENKNPKPKRVEWGPNVMFDGERCISCSRCIRYAKEHAKQDILTFVNRGDKVTIQVAEGEKFDNPYSMNVIEICPVGALTSKDFRFKSRVWEMSFNESVCPGCARGCNIKLGIRNNKILRMEPETNKYVNNYWACDYGRTTQIDFVNENRISQPHIKKGGELAAASFEEAFALAAEKLSQYKPEEIMFISSASATCEDNHVLNKFAKQIIKTENIDFFRDVDKSFGDEYLKVNDKTPNTNGVLEIGATPGPGGINIERLAESISGGKIKALYVMESDLSANKEMMDVLDNLSLLIAHVYNDTDFAKKADILLPATTYAESEGSFVNFKKRVQYIGPALVTKENMRYMGMKMSRLDRFGAQNDRWSHHDQRNCRQSYRMIMAIANLMGANWVYKRSADVFEEITKNIKSFKMMDYARLQEFQGLTLNKGGEPDKKIFKYQSHYLKPE